MAQIFFRGKLYIVSDSEFHDPTWTHADRNKFMMVLALQNPTTKSTYEQAIHVARMWIYRQRGCKYPSKWTSILDSIDEYLFKN